MQASSQDFPWCSLGVAVLVAALGWQNVLGDTPATGNDTKAAAQPSSLPPTIQETSPLLPTQKPSTGDSWRPRAKKAADATPAAVRPSQQVPSPPSQPPTTDGWRPRVNRPAVVVPATHQQTTPGASAVPIPTQAPPVRTTPQPTPEPVRKDDGDAETIPTLPTPVGSNQPPKDQQKLDRAALLGAARNAVKQGNYEQAIARFEEYLRLFGDDPAVRREYAGILFSANRYRQAIEQYQRLVNAQPNNIALRMTLGDIYMANKDYRKAAAEFTRILEQAPTNLDAATRLARAFALDEELPRAVQVYQQYLSQLQPGDENVPRTFGALLIDLDRPADALAFLQALREKHPDDLELLADLVRCYLRLGDRGKTTATLEELDKKAPRAIPVRLTLADTLYQSGEYEIAGILYSQIVRIDACNGFALVGTARVAVQMFEPAKARTILMSFSPTAPVVRIHKLTRAEYHQLVGEYIEAKQIYADFLSKDPADHEARLALAALDDYIREYEKAKAEYSKVPAESALGRKARLGFATTLFNQRFFDQTIEACKALLIENPSSGNALALMARSLANLGQSDQAEALCRDFLKTYAMYESVCLPVRFALGKLLLDAGKFGDAIKEYEALLDRPAGRVPAASYGLARGFEKIGDHTSAKRILESIISLVGHDFRTRLLLADLFFADYEDMPIVEMCRAVLKWDPQNLAALIRMADSQQRLARLSGDCTDAMQTCEMILAISPTNVRAHLALPRSLASTGKYREAGPKYERLIALDPEFTIPQRERARVLFSDHQFIASEAAYQQMLTPSADERLHLDLASYVRREPKIQEPVDLLLRADLPGNVLRTETAKLAAGTTDPDVQAGLQRILADYDARFTDQTGAGLEGEAKSKRLPQL
jgi:tetratricopeptide (TPR) repeat protein